MGGTLTPPRRRWTVTAETRQSASSRPTAWVGWVVFGAVLLLMMGVFQAVAGLVALLRDEFYLVAESGLVVEVSYTAWGWVHLLFGAIAVATGMGLLTGRAWARVGAVMIAALSAIINLAFIPAYPIWAVLIIALDVIIMYAVIVHGDELAS